MSNNDRFVFFQALNAPKLVLGRVSIPDPALTTLPQTP